MLSWTTLAVFCGALLYYVIADPGPCKVSDRKCLKKTLSDDYSKLVEGVPKQTEKLDPMHHDEINGSSSNLKYKMTDTTVTGFKDCKLEDLNVNLIDLSLQAELICLEFKMNGKYEIHGQLMGLPIEGSGDFSIYAKKYKITLDCVVKLDSGKDGKHYLSVKSYKFAAEPLESVKYDFKNLFKGQKDLADEAVKFAEDNGYEVAKEVQYPIFKANIKKLIKNGNKYLKNKPIEDIISL